MSGASNLDSASDLAFFESLRRSEFARLDANEEVYLDYTGAAPFFESLVEEHCRWLTSRTLGNPHSESRTSLAATAQMDAARQTVLSFFGVTDATHEMVFTANATAALRLVAEGFPFERGSRLVLLQDNHNSVNGIRTWALSAGARLSYLPLDGELRLADEALIPCAGAGPSLLAFPAQSNFSGVRHPLSLVTEARDAGYRVVLDAAAWAPTSPLDLSVVPADFTCVSFYKMFGYPTGVGALVARRDALRELRRPWFSGGTVDFVSVAGGVHRLRSDAQGFEDGTPDFLAAPAVVAGLRRLQDVGMHRLHRRVGVLTARLVAVLTAARHVDGSPLARIYGPGDGADRGGTVAFNILDADGDVVPYPVVVHEANALGISLRGGCFCNPGASEAAFGLADGRMLRCLQAQPLDAFDPLAVADCLGPGAVVGAVRASVGVATTDADLDVFASLLERLTESGVRRHVRLAPGAGAL